MPLKRHFDRFQSDKENLLLLRQWIGLSNWDEDNIDNEDLPRKGRGVARKNIHQIERESGRGWFEMLPIWLPFGPPFVLNAPGHVDAFVAARQIQKRISSLFVSSPQRLRAVAVGAWMGGWVGGDVKKKWENIFREIGQCEGKWNRRLSICKNRLKSVEIGWNRLKSGGLIRKLDAIVGWMEIEPKLDNKLDKIGLKLLEILDQNWTKFGWKLDEKLDTNWLEIG